MKIYRTQQEVERDIKDGVLKIDGDVKFECDVDINADIYALNINALNIDTGNIYASNIDAHDINALNIYAGNIDAGNINAWNINAYDIKADNIDVDNIDAGNISYWAFCNVLGSITCISIEGRREPHAEPICLDGELIREDDKTKEAVELLKSEGYKIVKEE